MRILLIDKLNDTTNDIISIISDKEHRYGFTDQEIEKIESSLLVNTFEELVIKFNPSIFMTIDIEHNEVKSTHYSNGAPDEIQIQLCQESGLFDRIKNLVNDIHEGNYAMYTVDDLKEGFWVCPSISEQDFILQRDHILIQIEMDHIKEAEAEMKRFLMKYDNALFLLHRFIQCSSEIVKSKVSSDVKYGKRFLLDDNSTILHSISVSENFRRNKFYRESVIRQYKQLIHKLIYQENGTYKNAQLLEFNMLMDCFDLSETEMQEIDRVQQKLLNFYEIVMQSYWRCAQPIIQTMLNCYLLFHNKDQNINMIICNCTIEELANSKRLDSFRTFLNTTNNKIYHNNYIDSAILPNLRMSEGKVIPIRIRFQARVKENIEYTLNDKEDADTLCNILSDYNIKTSCFKHTDGTSLSYDLIGEYTIEGNWLNKEQKVIYKWFYDLMLQV